MHQFYRAILLVGLAASFANAFDFTWTGTLDPRDDEWSVPGHWGGLFGFYPNTRSDSALIDGATLSNPELDLDVAIGAVTIRGGGVLDTNGFEYSVFTSGGLSGDTIIEDAGSMLRIYNDPGNPSTSGSGIIVNDGGTLLLDTTGLPVALNARKLDINTGGLVVGAGTLAQIGRTGAASNDGILRAEGGALVLQPWDAGVEFDWDGSSDDGRIEIDKDSELRVEMGVETNFDGYVNLVSGSVLDIEGAWTLGNDGILNVGSSPIFSNPARVRGGIMGVRGQIQVQFHGLILEAETALFPTGGITVTLGQDIQFDAPATLPQADGLQFLSGNCGMIVKDDVSIGSGLGSGRFDMDGPNGDTEIEIHNTDTLTIDADGIDASDDRFDGLIDMFGESTLDLRVTDGEWEMAGLLRSNAGSGAGTILGSAVRVSGDIDVVSGDFEILTVAVFEESATINLTSPFNNITVNGPVTTLDGADFIGGARPAFLSPLVRVTGDTTITSDINLILGDDTTLEIDAPLRVNTARIRSESVGPEIRGTTIINAPGFLDFTNTGVSDSTQLFDGPLELHGPAAAGLIQGDRFRIEGPMSVSGSVAIGSTVELNCPISIDAPNTNIFLYGGTAEDPSIIEPGTVISNNSNFDIGTVSVMSVTRVLSGTSLGGSIWDTWVAPAVGELILEPGADGGRQILNRGILRMGNPGEPIGIAHADFFDQDLSGNLHIRVGPTGADALFGITTIPFTDTHASLDGALIVTLDEGYEPVHNELHTIISFDSVVGEFDTVTGPDNMEVVYDPDRVRIWFTITACNAADVAEPFGVLDLGDVIFFIDGFQNQDPIADLDANGVFDLADVSLFVTAFLAGCP